MIKRSKSSFRRLLLALTALFITMIYSVPQLMHSTRHGKGAYLMSSTEETSRDNVARVLEGDFSLSFPETVLAAPAYAWNKMTPAPWNMGADAVIIIARLILPALGFLAFFSALWVIGFKTSVAYLSAFWFYLELSPSSYTPLSGILEGTKLLETNRLADPLLPLLVFFMAVHSGARSLYSERRTEARNWAVLTGFLVAVQFHFPGYYWAHLVFGLILATALVKSPFRWKTLGWCFLVAFIISAPVLVMRDFSVSGILDWSGRDLSNRRLWLMAFASSSIIYFRQPRAGYMLSFIIAGIVSAWHPTLSPMIMAGAAWGVDYSLRMVLRSDYFRLIPSLSGIFLVLIAAAAIRAGQNAYLKTEQAVALFMGRR